MELKRARFIKSLIFKIGTFIGPSSASPSKSRTFYFGPSTEVLVRVGHIITAGGIDSHIYFICPRNEIAP